MPSAQPSTVVTTRSAFPNIVEHRSFLLFLLLFVILSLCTIADFPTVDKTNDDMWNVDWGLAMARDGKAHQTVNMLPILNQMSIPFEINTASSGLVFKYFGSTIFALRVKNLLFGIGALIVIYAFSLRFFRDRTWALLAAIGSAMTNGFMYRSHDARSDIIAVLFFLVTMWLCYLLVVEDDDRKRPWRIFWLTIVVLCFFRQVHLNGAIAGVIAFGSVLIGRPKVLVAWRSWAGLLAGGVVYAIYDIGLNALLSHAGGPVPAQAAAWHLTDYLGAVPIYTTLSFHSVGGFAKSLFHIVGLVLKFPPRFLGRINTQTLSGYLDLLLLGLVPVAVVVRFIVSRRLSAGLQFLLIWLVLFFVCMALFCGSRTDYSAYIMPVAILILLASLRRDDSEADRVAWRRAAYGLVALQTVFILFCLAKIKFVDRYAAHLHDLDVTMAGVIPAHASVIGAPIYFTMLEPRLALDYREIYQSVQPTDPFNERFFAEAHYDFTSEFMKKRFQYVIYDDFFRSAVAKIGFGGANKSFPDSLLGNYEIIKSIDTRYPTKLGMIKHVDVYRLRE